MSEEIEIERLTPQDAARAARLIAAAFHDDPVMVWALNGARGIEPIQTVLARAVYLRHGFGYQTRDDAAGTLWLPPSPKTGLNPMDEYSLLFQLLRYGGLKGLKRATAMGSALARNKPKTPHYYLYTISVHPRSQGKGLGRRILAHTLEQIDRERAPAYLENSKAENTPFYRAMGFELMGEVVMTPGCPPMWPMWRTGESGLAPN